MVGKVFSSVAESYDIMNDAMSLGVHRCWKDTFVGMIGSMRTRKVTDEKGNIKGEEPLRVLDVAGGTGDISFRIYDKAKSEATGSKYYQCLQLYIELPVEITVSDINPNMLEVGKRRSVEKGIFHGRILLSDLIVNRPEVSCRKR